MPQNCDSKPLIVKVCPSTVRSASVLPLTVLGQPITVSLWGI